MPSFTAYVKIAEGCDNACAFCIIPKLRGAQRSRPIEDIVKEAERLASEGVRELNLVAQDLTAYGHDLPGKPKLHQLLKELARVKVQWIRLHYAYPRVFPDLVAHQAKYSDTSVLPTPVFFHGMERGEETSIDIERGKTLIVKFLTVGEPHVDGTRTLFFELNGQPREAVVVDRSLADVKQTRMAEASNADQVGSPMPGLVVRVLVSEGDPVTAGQKLFTLEAMKMETTVYADRTGVVSEVLVTPGTQVEAGELLLCYREEK